MRFAQMRERAHVTGRIDLGDVDPLTPTTLLPLSIFIKRSPLKMALTPSDDPDVDFYLEFMRRHLGIESLNGQTYLPIVGLPDSQVLCQLILRRIYRIGEDVGGKSAFRYLVGELVDNIYQHSLFNDALIMVQKSALNGEMRICIIDDGITIGGSLARAGMDLDDDQAIVDAVQGASSKKDDERGRGLGSVLKMIIEGYHGNVLIASGKGAVHYDEGGPLRYRFSDAYKYEGTMISMTIPLMNEEVNVFDYAEM